MTDIILEILRIIIVGVIFVYLWLKGSKEEIRKQKGWRYILTGFAFLLFGMIIDVTDNFPSLNKYIIIGDTEYQAFLEKVVGYLCGFLLLAIGFWKWIPAIILLGETERALKKSQDELELRIEERTTHLKSLNKQLKKEVNERKNVENKLRESEEMYRSLVESTEDSIYLVDKDCNYLFMNENHSKRMGFSGDEYLRRSFSECHSSDDNNWLIENVNKIFQTGRSIKQEHKSLKDDRYFLLTLSPVKKNDRKIIAVTVISKEITHLKHMEEELRTLSITDALTGIYNRRGFFALAEHKLKLAKREKRGIFLLYADVNKLKIINDTYGHKEGDSVLIETATLLKETYRESDITARIGGDEFVVIPVGAARDSIENIAARFQRAIDNHNEKINRKYKLTLSVGIVYYDPENPCSLEHLVDKADKAMYEHKNISV